MQIPKKIVAIIQARSSSTRLPNKGLLKIGNKLAIERVVDRIKAVNLLEEGLIDEIIVAVPVGDPIADWCSINGIKCFEGSKEDVLDRFFQVAQIWKAAICVRICADCVFIEPVMVRGLIKEFQRLKHNYLALGFNRGAIPGGWDCEVFTFEYLKNTWEKAKEREHISKEMRAEDEDEKDLGLPFSCKGVKLDLDTQDDLKRLQEYAKSL